MSMDEVVTLGLEGLKKSSEDSLTADTTEVAVIKKGKPFERLEPEEVKKFMEKL
jgi:20S proteasome alpha/beta subunit